MVLNVDRLKSRHCREEVCESLAGNDLVPVAGSNVQSLDGGTELGVPEGSHELGGGLAAQIIAAKDEVLKRRLLG